MNLDDGASDGEEGDSAGEEVELSNDTAEKVDLDDFLKREDDESGGYDYSDDYYGGGDNDKMVTLQAGWRPAFMIICLTN